MYMLQSSPPDGAFSLLLVEGGLTAIVVALSFAWPRLGSGWFTSVERIFKRLARRPQLAVAMVGLTVLLLRLAILPWRPIPLPFSPGDFSFLLAADTFAHGRLASPTPAMWVHLESIHIDMRPTYGSMYFPAQGLVLAAAKVLLGHPWYGLLIVSALMCAVLCWMLQAWLPPSWALLGGMLAVLRLALFSYWTNTYHSAGSIAVLGGALVLGALPRFTRTARAQYALLMAVGFALLAITRPYECLLLAVPVAAMLIRWWLNAKNRPAALVLLRRIVPALALLGAVAVWMGYYDYRAFGSPLILPYTVNRATYAMAPYYVWQSPRPEPAYQHEAMRRFYYQDEMNTYAKIHSPSGFVSQTVIKLVLAARFFIGFALLPPLLMIRRVLLDRRIRILVLCVLVLAAGMAVEVFMLPHYLAPFTAAFYAIGVQAMRHLWHWSPGGQSVGMTMVRLIVTVCLLTSGLRLFNLPLHMPVSESPPTNWNDEWYGPDFYGTERAAVEHQLDQLPGQQLILVRYSSGHDPGNEWVYNAADIDGSKVIWAREMDAVNNQELLQYYKNRQAWLVQPDLHPAGVTLYPVSEQVTPSVR